MGSWFRRLSYLFQQSRRDADLRVEIETHRSLRQRQLEESGLSADDAAFASRRALGNVTLASEEVRDMLTGRLRRIAESTWQDIVFAVRGFRHQPLIFAMAIVGLALGLGVSTAVFSLLNGIMLRPFGMDASQSVVKVYANENGNFTGWSLRNYEHVREGVSVARLESVATEDALYDPMRTDSGSREVPLSLVSGGYMAMLGARAALGRVLTQADDTIGAPPVVVVSHLFWSRHLDGDPTIVGRTVSLEGVRVTVVGVSEKGFTGPTDRTPAFWTTVAHHQLLVGRELESVTVYARLNDGVGISQAQAAIGSAASGLDVTRESGSTTITGVLLQRAERRPAEDEVNVLRVIVIVVMILIAMVVIVASVNLANLLLAYGITRQREIGLRLALGASRLRVIRQMLTESALLGFAAGVCGLLLATWLVSLLVKFGGVPREFVEVVDVTPDVRVYAFLFGSALVASLLAGVAPARYGSRGDLLSPLKEARPTQGELARPRRLRAVLLGLQSAIAVLFLVLATLLTRSAVEAARADVGFDARRLLVVSSDLRRARYDSVRASAYWERGLAKVQEIPGVESAAVVLHPPLSGESQVFLDSSSGRVRLFSNRASPSYFDTMGLSLLKGRIYTAGELSSGAQVAVISAALAARYWPASEPVGDTLERVHDSVRSWSVIGVVADAMTERLGSHAAETIYRPLRHSDARDAHLLIRAASHSTQVAVPVSAAFRSMDAAARPRVQFVTDALSRELEQPRQMAVLSGVLALVSIGLAIAGIHGVASFVIGRRAREIAVRIALGATRQDLARQLIRETLKPVVAGLVGGLLAVVLFSHVLSSVLYGISARDPLSFFGGTVLLLGAALLAVAPAVWRAARLSPAAVLKVS